MTDVKLYTLLESYANYYWSVPISYMMYLQSGFTEDECVDTVTKQFHVGKKVTRELVKKRS